MKLKIIRFLDAATEYSIYGVIFFIPISIALIGTFVAFALAFFLLKQIFSRDFSSLKANKLLFLLLLAFFIFMGLSLLNSGPLLAKSLKAILLKWGRFPLLLWAILDTFRSKKRIVKAGYVILFSATLVGLTVITQRYFGFEFLRGRALSGYRSPSMGPFKTSNALAAFLTCVTPVVLSFGLSKWKHVTVKLCFLLIAGMLILSSFWTVSRGGWMGLMSGLLFVTLVTNYQRIRKIFWPTFWSSFIIFLPLAGSTLFFFNHRRTGYRYTLYRGAWRMIQEHPLLGKGVGTFMDYCVLYANTPVAYYAHNCFLQIWAESGIFSLLSFLLFVSYVFYNSIRVILKVSASFNPFLLIGLNAGLLGFLVHSFFEVHLYSFQLSFLFWTLLGLTVSLSSSLNQE